MVAIYSRLLNLGLPNWRNPLYYYRASQKMSLSQVSLQIYFWAHFSFLFFCLL
jgi:hypothetical protein